MATFSFDAPSMAEFNALKAQVEALGMGGGIPLEGGGGSISPFIWHRNSGNSSERVEQLLLTSKRASVFSIKLPEIGNGDLIQAFATFEVTNPYTFNVMVGRGMIISETASGNTGIEISEYATRNISKNMHHDHIEDFGTIIGTSAMSNKFVNLVAYADSDAASSGQYVKVEQDYGRLVVMVFRKFALEN